MDQSEGRDFGVLHEKVTRAQETPPSNELLGNENGYVLSTDGSCCVVGNHQR